MEAKPHSVKITQEARYFTLGELTADTPALWMVCHGYGQLASYFIKHFRVLADAGHYIVAPEGLSRFYLQGFSGRVGACWMTKEDRQTDIHNYISYLSEVHKAAFKGHTAPLNLLGFSQGVATVSRWSILSGIPFNELVLWAGVFPPDLPLKSLPENSNGRKITIVYGENDPFINKEQKEDQIQALYRLKVAPRIIEFPGKHEINEQVLKSNFLSY